MFEKGSKTNSSQIFIQSQTRTVDPFNSGIPARSIRHYSGPKRLLKPSVYVLFSIGSCQVSMWILNEKMPCNWWWFQQTPENNKLSVKIAIVLLRSMLGPWPVCVCTFQNIVQANKQRPIQPWLKKASLFMLNLSFNQRQNVNGACNLARIFKVQQNENWVPLRWNPVIKLTIQVA